MRQGRESFARRCGFLILTFISLVPSFNLHAEPELIWDRAQQPKAYMTGLSQESLLEWEDTILAQGETTPIFLAQVLAIGVRRQDVSIIDKTLDRLETVQQPIGIDEHLSHTHLYLLAYQANKEVTYLQRIEHHVWELKRLLDERITVDTPDTPVTAAITQVLLKAGTVLQSKALTKEGVELLEFIEQRLVGQSGAFHQLDVSTGIASLDGQLIDNAAAGLAFYEGYLKTANERYLHLALRLADFILDRLQDRKFGGFFARNSASLHFYQPFELFVDDKPIKANAMAALLLMQIGWAVAEDPYLIAASKALAVAFAKQQKIQASTDTAILLTAYQALVANAKTAGDSDLQDTEFGILLLLSFIAGVFGFLSPCTLPILPAYFAFAFQSDKKRIVMMTLAFFLGLSLSFSIMGATATFVGAFLSKHYAFFLKLGSVLIILFGISSLLGKGFSGAHFTGKPVASLFGSLVFGLTFSIGWTACIGPILGAILLIAASQQDALLGAIYLFVFAMGLSMPLIGLSLLLKNIDRSGLFWQLLKGKGWAVDYAGVRFHIHTSGLLSGGLLIAIGILMWSGSLTYLNQVLPIEIQAWFAEIEESLLDIFRR